MRDILLRRADPFETAENVASIERVPPDILPPGPARDALVRLAAAGEDAYCYASGSELTGT